MRSRDTADVIGMIGWSMPRELEREYLPLPDFERSKLVVRARLGGACCFLPEFCLELSMLPGLLVSFYRVSLLSSEPSSDIFWRESLFFRVAPPAAREAPAFEGTLWVVSDYWP